MFGGFGWYLFFIAAMIGCSIGLPYPEEAVLLGAGYAAHDGVRTGVQVVPAIVVCAFGVLLGDSLIYSLGRYIGPPVLQRWPFRKHFTQRRVRLARLSFMRHGGKILLPIRLVPVVRAVAHFTAGTLKYSYWRFLMWDGIGVCIVVPISVWLAYYFGDKIAYAVEQGSFWLGVAAGGAFAAWAVWLAFFRKRRDAPTMHELPTQIIEQPRE